jgi:hypothetical protein
VGIALQICPEWPGTETTARRESILLERRNPIAGVCSTCSAIFLSGVTIHHQTIRICQPLIGWAVVMDLCALSAAVLGELPQRIVVYDVLVDVILGLVQGDPGLGFGLAFGGWMLSAPKSEWCYLAPVIIVDR